MCPETRACRIFVIRDGAPLSLLIMPVISIIIVINISSIVSHSVVAFPLQAHALPLSLLVARKCGASLASTMSCNILFLEPAWGGR